jgi:hypothetical protein
MLSIRLKVVGLDGLRMDGRGWGRGEVREVEKAWMRSDETWILWLRSVYVRSG